MAEVERLGFFLSRAPICAGLAANELVRAGRKVEVSHSLRSPTWVQVPCDRSSFRQARVGLGGGNIAQALLWIGGMVFFGFATIIASITCRLRKHKATSGLTLSKSRCAQCRSMAR